MDLSFLPPVEASINAVVVVLLIRGRRLIRRGDIDGHRRTMIIAAVLNALFLTLYVIHKISNGFESMSFGATGAALLAYRAFLVSHLVPAIFLLPTIVLLIKWAGQPRHQRLARIAWPVWLYVAVTGVLIYLLLYHFNPA